MLTDIGFEPMQPDVSPSGMESVMKISGLILLGLLLSAAVASGQPGQPPLAFLQDEIRPGETLLITTSNGTRMTGRLRTLPAASLTIQTADGPRTLPADQVQRIVVKDSIRNGLLIGLGTGAAVGATGGLLVNAICVNESGACPGTVLLLAGIGAAAGAGIGAGVDGLRHQTVLDFLPDVPHEFSPEIGLDLGVARSSMFGARLIGPPSLGAGWLIRHTSGFGLALDVTRTVGRATHSVSCADGREQASIAHCVGGDDGVVDTTIAAAKAQYYFTRSRVQPYVSGGAALYQDSMLVVNTVQPFPDRPPFARQSLGRHHGIALVAGGGMRVGGRHASVRPDVTFYKSGAWTHVRASVGVAFGW